jgi:D-alanine-D-alanine ligase
VRVLVLLHPDLIRPSSAPDEERIVRTLRKAGHEVRTVGVLDEWEPLRTEIVSFKPNIAFNMLEEFAYKSFYDQNVVSFLQMAGVPFTGNTPRGLILARDKMLTKKVLAYHGIKTPRCVVYPVGGKFEPPSELGFPLFVKSKIEDASLGISQSSIVRSEVKLKERVRFIHESIGTDALAEEFIEGKDVYVGIVGNGKLHVFPPWELVANGKRVFATANLKHSRKFRRKFRVKLRRAKSLAPNLESSIIDIARRVFQALYLSGYARIDFRVTTDGTPYVLEANPNPDLSKDECLARAAADCGVGYPELLEKILHAGMKRPIEMY